MMQAITKAGRWLKGWLFKNVKMLAAFAVGLCLGGAFVGRATGVLDLTGIATMILVGVTIVYVLVAWMAINDARNSRVEETMPQVILFFDLDPQSPHLIYLVLKNSGRRPAHNVTVSSSPSIRDTSPPMHEFFGEGIALLAPGQALRTFFGSAFEVMAENSSVPKDYKVTVEWDDGLTGKRIYGNQPITLRDFQSLTYLGPSSADPLERIATGLEQSTGIVNRIMDYVRGQE